MTHPAVQDQARNFYTLHEIEEEAQTVGSIVYVVKVGDLPLRDMVREYLNYFRRTPLPPQKVTHDVIQVGGVRIFFVSTQDENWETQIQGYTNFISE